MARTKRISSAVDNVENKKVSTLQWHHAVKLDMVISTRRKTWDQLETPGITTLFSLKYKEFRMSNPEQITTSAGIDHQLDEMQNDPVADVIEIEPEMLADVAGGPDGTA